MSTTPQVPDPSTGLPIGPLVESDRPATEPAPVVLEGRYCRLEPLDPDRHGDQLFKASSGPDAARRFLYLPNHPPADRLSFQQWLEWAVESLDQRFWAVIEPRSGQAAGRQAYMRIDPPNRSIEIGNVYWGPTMARSRMSTEALFLFARHAFDDLGYQRFEWKCNALNEPSRRAAERFGFQREGVFRRAAIIKGRTRDTAWFSMIDEEWPLLRAAFEGWLDPSNFDDHGVQRRGLEQIRGEISPPS